MDPGDQSSRSPGKNIFDSGSFGAAWWPVTSRLMTSHSDYHIQNLVATTSSATFGSINQESIYTGFDVLNQQAQQFKRSSISDRPGSLPKKSASPASVGHSPDAHSARSRACVSSLPIYTNPSTGVTITPINLSRKSSGTCSFQNENGNTSTTKLHQEAQKPTDEKPAEKPSVGVHILPVSVITKTSSASHPPTSKAEVINLKLDSPAKTSCDNKIPSQQKRKKDATSASCESDSHSELSSDSSMISDTSCGSSDDDENLASLSQVQNNDLKSQQPRKSDLKHSRKVVNKKGSECKALSTASPAQDAESLMTTSSTISSNPLDSAVYSNMNAPLNLTKKSQSSSEVRSQSPSVSIGPSVKKPKPKLKNINHVNASDSTLQKQIQDELRKQLEEQLKQQQYRMKMARKYAAAAAAEQKEKDMETKSQQSHSSSSKLKSPPAPQVIITTAKTSAQSKSLSHTPNVVTITAIPSSKKAVSLLTGTHTVLNEMSEPYEIGAPKAPFTSRTSLSHSKSSASKTISKSSAINNSPSKFMPIGSLGDTDSFLDTQNESGANGSLDEPTNLTKKHSAISGDSSDDDSSEDDSSEESDSSSKSESSSSESESESETSDTEDTERSRATSTGSTPVSSTPGQKRPRHNESGSVSPTKKRKIILDEKELRIPLEHGWRRQTKIRTFSYSGVRGIVTYFAPCGRKLKTYPEVIRYLDKHKINDINRENFSFSTKVNIGEFLESVDGGNDYVLLNEAEVIARIEEIRARKGRRSSSKRDHRRSQGHKHDKKEDAKNQRRIDQQELARRVNEMKLLKKAEKEQEKSAAKEAKKLQALELKRQKEHLKLMRQQEKFERQEQMRLEKEMRAQQMIEERELKRQQAVFLKEQELQKRREMLIMVDLERERRRQHMLLVKALEARKKQEERERLKEEKMTEKRLNKERKMEQRRLELELLREMKKPIEDMELRDAEPLPTLNRIPGVKLPGKAFSDILMVLEFLHNFGETLGFDMDSLPTLNTLQMAMLNNEDAEEEVLSILHHLLTCVIDDPGVPALGQNVNILNQTLKDVDITSSTVSEVLRIYLQAVNGENDEMVELLKLRPFVSLNVTQKASILAFICNELLCSRAICQQIENSIDSVNNLRRDKWMVEGRLRKMKTIQCRKLKMQNKAENQEKDKETEASDRTSKTNSPCKAGREEEDGAANESGNESEGSHGTGHCDAEQDEQEDEEMSLSTDELKKQIDKLGKQLVQFRNKLVKASQQLRAMSFGQDRYKRRYWVLPYTGGVFVEGMESAELSDFEDIVQDESLPEKEVKIKKENDDLGEKTSEAENIIDSKDIKTEPSVEEEKEEINASAKPSEPVTIKTEEENNLCNENKCSLNNKGNNNLFLKKPEELGKLSDYISDTPKLSPTKAKSPTNSCCSPAEKSSGNHSLFSGVGINSGMFVNGPLGLSSKELNGGFMNYLGCDSPSHNGSFNSMYGYPQFPLSAEQLLKTLSDKSSEKSWFSILPRMPCDETSLTRLHGSPLKNNLNSSLPKYASSPYSAFQLFNNSASFTPLQLGMLNGMPPFPLPHPLGVPNSVSTPITPSENNHISTSNRSVSALTPSSVNSTPRSTPGPSNPAPEPPVPLEKIQQHEEPQPIPIELQKGWWRITDANQLKSLMKVLHQRGIRERILFKQFEKYDDFACNSCGKGNEEATDLEITDLDRKISQLPGGAPEEDDPDKWNPDAALRVELAVLEQVESIEEKVFNSSMQVKGWKLPAKASSDDINFQPSCLPSNEIEDSDEPAQFPLECAKERLRELEQSIEPRYIKPPLGYSTPEMNISNLSNTSSTEPQSPVPEEIPAGLKLWREALNKANSAAQLAMCIGRLESCIAWDKSIMKASCQFCHSGDNEEMLLLCDGCDKGYHTYCFKPKMESIPDGDWFCNECLNKATGDPVCMVCGKKGKNLCICDSCPKAYHIDCLEPPLSRVPKGKWLCPHCNQKPNKSRSKSSKKKEKDEGEESSSKMDKSRSDKTKEKPKPNRDLGPCRIILAEMETHEDAWPFLLPVNTKQFPSYRKVIKKPMDLSTIKNKLQDGSYKSREEFIHDARLIFDNCETFNEDDSPVGKAGHSMRAFFESQWTALTGN